ncbi:zinc ribbon domain-containing protein [Fimbriiglobus ruber]|uniref:C4-type zinc ribbon domain-containing protein n=1 Tax=Fimbriiglobus ruber TaxID=1908690 RepID=A0A225E456_9BACT|nr:hypothetical protein [Fimbriiglobus ruber]OWK43465.1 hypothetical protein FRUB_03064 [Fimbriiglobus ruber]
MSEKIAPILRELHRLRKHLRELQSEIDLGPRVLKIQEQKLAAEEQAHKDAYDAIKKLKLQQKEDEGALKTVEQQLAKFQADLNTAGSKKEFDAKQTEIANASTKKGTLEDTILTTITDIEERTAKLPEVEAQWATAQKDFAQYKIDAKERLERLTADQKMTQEEVAKYDERLPLEMKGQYLRLIKTYGADGLAAVVGRGCQQCRTTITEQQRTNIAGGMFICCSQCGRGLYMADS